MPTGTRAAVSVAFVLLALILSRRPLLALLAVPLLLVGGTLAVLGLQLWLTRLADQKLRERGVGVEGRQSGGKAGRRTRRAGPPPLYFTSPAAWSMTQTKAEWEATGDDARRGFPDAPPFLNAAVDSLLSLILRDFVLKWYSNISDSPVFPHAVETTIRETLQNLTVRVAKQDWSDVLVGRILPLLTSHLDKSRVAESATGDEDDLLAASRYAKELDSHKLHPAVDVASTNSRPAEEEWLRSLIESMLPLILPERELDSPAVRVMVREIVSCAVMLPIFDMLGDPDFYNRIIDDKAGAAIRDQRMVDQFRAALDKQSPAFLTSAIRPFTSSGAVSPAKRRTEAVTVRTSPRHFDNWIKGISTIKDVGDAKRLRSDVTGQIRRAKAMTDGKALDELVDDVRVAEWIDFVERLYAAKRKVDRRIVKLGGTVGSSRASIAPVQAGQVASFGLRTILLDPTAVSYLMEFLERRRHALRAQFWLLVEGLKDPLENVDPDKAPVSAAEASTVSTAFEDAKMIWDAYLVDDPFHSPPLHLFTIKSFVESYADAAATPQDVRRVRHALFSIQGEVFSLIEEEDFPDFKRSELYFRAIADVTTSTSTITSPGADERADSPSPSRLRPRTHSDPQVPTHSLLQPSRSARAASPTPPRPSSPGFAPPRALHRTDTAPPQVSFDAAVGRPRAFRSNSLEDLANSDPFRRSSAGSLDTMSASLSSLPPSKRKTPMANSLEFLMSPPPVAEDRSPLFEGDGFADEGANSDDDYVQVETIEAIQDALNSILASDDRALTEKGKLVSASVMSSEAVSPTSTFSRRPLPHGRPPPPPRHPSLTNAMRTSPTLTRRSLSPVNPPSPPVKKPRAKAVFDDEEESFEDTELEEEGEFDPQSVRVAAPGDLYLPAEVARLAEAVEKLKAQEAVVDALIRKAELTGNASELKILVKSRESLRREIRAASFQKDQYEAQASENELSPDRTRVTISGTTVGQAGGQSFQLYLVEVHQLDAQGARRSGWIVTKRYSEFATLYSKIRDKYVAARYLEFPSKRLVGTYSKDFIEQRRAGLERYLQALVKVPVICRSNEFRAFLSQATIALPKADPDRKPSVPLYAPGQNLFRTLYRSVTSGIDDVLGTSTTSLVDEIIERLSQQAAEFAGLPGATVNAEDLVGQLIADQASTSSAAAAVTSVDSRIGEEGLTYFTAPICDLFITIFSLKEKNNWLRRQAILIVLQQVLGGAIERKFRDSVKLLLAPPQLVAYIDSLKNGLWPDGELKAKTPPRTAAEKAATKDSANRKLAALMPDVAANLIGRHNARQGARRLFSVLQNRRLNKHLIYSVVDEVVAVLFPELKKRSTTDRLGYPRPLFLS
ncbi:hypothetical protein JCM10207_003023 [Rhodosporidiobolus poonsookiae]